ncbi:unnamed protein product [Heterobilharzia americana]|nr:unnamed protein product [Heterobilharzia americana]
MPPATAELPVNTSLLTKTEVLNAIKLLEFGKAVGPDGIRPEALKTDSETTADMLTPLLFLKAWKERYLRIDWKEGYFAKLLKKGDVSLYKNWQGIMLLSTRSKIPSRVILESLKDVLDSKLRPEQTGWLAGFRKNKSYADRISTLCIIIEQSIEWQSTLPQLHRL